MLGSLEQTNGNLQISKNEVETKNGNYLLLNVREVEAIKHYSGYSSVIMNMLFTTDIKALLPRLQHWARADEIIETFLTAEVVSNVINLYSALLKAHIYHSSDADTQTHPSLLHRGYSGNEHSNGFKSFTRKLEMAQSFGVSVVTIHFPRSIPYLSNADIYNYAPHTSRREEEEYLFSPFCEIRPAKFPNFFSARKVNTLSATEIKGWEGNLPDNLTESLKMMASLILEYKNSLIAVEHLDRWQSHDVEYRQALLNKERIEESYREASQQVLNLILSECAKLNEVFSGKKYLAAKMEL